MKVFYDTEFVEDGRTIDLISIGLVAEDGREYYAVQKQTRKQWRRLHKHAWLRENVLPGLPTLYGDARLYYAGRSNPLAIDFYAREFKPRERIRTEVAEFIQDSGPDVELWADYGAYDHVVLCQLFGTMMDLPSGVPMWTHDFQQAWEAVGRPELPPQTVGLHNALADAQHLRLQFLALVSGGVGQ